MADADVSGLLVMATTVVVAIVIPDPQLGVNELPLAGPFSEVPQGEFGKLLRFHVP